MAKFHAHVSDLLPFLVVIYCSNSTTATVIVTKNNNGLKYYDVLT